MSEQPSQQQPDETPQYKPGDVANGHQLNENNEWLPYIPTEAPKSSTGRRNSIAIVAGTAVVALILGLVAGAAVGGGQEGQSASAPTPTVTVTVSVPVPVPAPVEPAPVIPAPVEPAPVVPVATPPKPSDYSVTPKILRKACFGSAGCNLIVRLNVDGNAATKGVNAELTVSVTGDENGPSIEPSRCRLMAVMRLLSL